MRVLLTAIRCAAALGGSGCTPSERVTVPDAEASGSLAVPEGNGPFPAVALYVGADYIQHNSHVATGKAGIVQYFEDMARRYPGKSVEFKRVFADGSFVLLHCHQVWLGLPDYAGIDIFRLDEQGKIVEHWDVLQEIPKECAHTSGMF